MRQNTDRMAKEHLGKHQSKNENKAALAKKAKIKFEEARQVALKRASGRRPIG